MTRRPAAVPARPPSPGRRNRRPGPAACLGLLALTAVPLAAWPAAAPEREDIEEYFTGDWYYIEVLVFDRPTVMDFSTEERLTRAPAPLPLVMQELGDSGQPGWPVQTLYPETRAQLSFPYLDVRRLAEDPDAQEPLDPAALAAPQITPRLEPDPLLDLLNRIGTLERELASRSEQWLPAEELLMDGPAARLTRSDGFRVLLHGRWLQNVPAREAPLNLRVRGGPTLDGRPALEGTVAVTLGRYLHFRADLYYHAPLLGQPPVDRAAAPDPAGTGAGSLDPAMLRPAGYVQMHQSRRLRSEELHYLDHPKLGVLVRIDPVPLPEELEALYLALQESLEEGAE